MLDWYHVFIAAVLLLWLVSTPRDRNSLRIVLIASLASEVIVDEITHQIEGAWKLVIPGALEILTILALLKWARNRTGIMQAGLLVFAWLAHVLCYWDIYAHSDIVYSRYESILFWVSVGQLATCYDTMQFNLSRACHFASTLWSYCFFGIPSTSPRFAVPMVVPHKAVQKIERKSEVIKKNTVASSL